MDILYNSTVSKHRSSGDWASVRSRFRAGQQSRPPRHRPHHHLRRTPRRCTSPPPSSRSPRYMSGVFVYARDWLPVSPGGEEHGGFGYAWSKSDLDIPRSLLIWWRVPVARSRLPCLGMIALRPLAGFTHISWDPSAWRRNLQPRDSNFVRSSL